MSADEDFDWSFPLDRTRASVQESAILESLARRARPGERSEELLFDLGLLDEHDFALEIASRAGRAYAGLRDFVPDPRLFVYLPLPIAVRERVCPLVLIGDSLKVASAFLDPELSHLEGRFPNLTVELGIAPRSEILAALNRVTELL
jgi:hypothetical protein